MNDKKYQKEAKIILKESNYTIRIIKAFELINKIARNE